MIRRAHARASFWTVIVLTALAAMLAPASAAAQGCPYGDFQEFAQYVLSSHSLVEVAQSARSGQSGIMGQVIGGVAGEGVKRIAADTKAVVDQCPEFRRGFLEKGLQGGPQASDPLERALMGALMKGLTQGNPDLDARVRRAQAWLASIR